MIICGSRWSLVQHAADFHAFSACRAACVCSSPLCSPMQCSTDKWPVAHQTASPLDPSLCHLSRSVTTMNVLCNCNCSCNLIREYIRREAKLLLLTKIRATAAPLAALGVTSWLSAVNKR